MGVAITANRHLGHPFDEFVPLWRSSVEPAARPMLPPPPSEGARDSGGSGGGGIFKGGGELGGDP